MALLASTPARISPYAGAVHLEITHFTDPACPFAFSAEPVRMRLRWHYGDQLRWTTRMIVLTLEPGEAEKLADGARAPCSVALRHAGRPRARTRAPPPRSRPAARSSPRGLHAPERQDALLRRLRARVMVGGLLDDPELIAGAARDAGLDPAQLREWCAT